MERYEKKIKKRVEGTEEGLARKIMK